MIKTFKKMIKRTFKIKDKNIFYKAKIEKIIKNKYFLNYEKNGKIKRIIWIEPTTDNDFFEKLKNSKYKIDLDFENYVKYILKKFGNKPCCNRFTIGNCIEYTIADLIFKSNFTVNFLPNSIYDIKNYKKLSIKYSSCGNIKLHNSNNQNTKSDFTDLLLITPQKIYLITNSIIKQKNIKIKDFLKNTGDKLFLKRKFINKKNMKNYEFKTDINKILEKFLSIEKLLINKSIDQLIYMKNYEFKTNINKINKINKILEKFLSIKKQLLIKSIDQLMYPPKGHVCSVNGRKYEQQNYNIIKNCSLNGQIFNTQNIEDLGGSTSINDIQCNFIKEQDIGIEIKKYNTPDWMQCSIKYNENLKIWETSKKCKIPKKCRDLFTKFLNGKKLFKGNIPPFMKKKLTHNEWVIIKQNTDLWNDSYFDIPNDTIKKLYSLKNCQYIQISNYGLYNLGNDICKFNVPEFNIEQKIRIRTKIHKRKNKQGFCNLSVIISPQPKNIKLLIKSPYSLDNKNKLPKNLIYNS